MKSGIISIFFIVTFFLLYHKSMAQDGFRARCYNTNAFTHITENVFETTPGNYMGLGLSIENQNGSSVYLLSALGLNSNGKQQWMKSYGRKNLQYVTTLFTFRTCIKRGSYIYYTGVVLDSNQKYLGVLVKFDFNGNLIWQKFYTDSQMPVYPQSLTSSVDGGFLITGLFEDLVNPNRYTLLIKTDAAGNELWRKKIAKAIPNASDGKAILQDSASKKIIIVGYQYDYPINSANQWTLKDNILVLDSLGNVLSRSFFHIGTANDVIQTKDKKIVIVGNNEQYLNGTPRFTSFAIKFDINTPNVPIWHINNYGHSTKINSFNSVVELPGGDILIGGSFDSLVLDNKVSNSWSRFVWLSASGQVLKQKYYDYSPDKTKDNVQWLTSLNLTSDGGWLTSLRCYLFPNNPIYYVKYSNIGCDSTTFYCTTVGLDEIKTKPKKLRIYPNPTTDILVIEQDIRAVELELKLTDALGREIKRTLMNGLTTLNLRDLNAGIYFVELWHKDERIVTEKIIKE